MMIIKTISILLITWVGIVNIDAIQVELKCSADGTWQLLKDGKPFRVKGVGRIDHLDMVAQCGVNTARTYSITKLSEVKIDLDRAYAHGVMVIAGIYVERESKTFSYLNPKDIESQRKRILNGIRSLKDHPTILIWGLGNESEGPWTKEIHPEYWRELGRLAEMIKREDPNHPVMVSTAGNQVWKIKAVKQYAPFVDIMGINAYAAVKITVKRLTEAGWNKPFIQTEFGPISHLEVSKTSWGAPIEPSSEQKADSYEAGYRIVTADKKRCLGTVCFVWAQKQEKTATWYGMFLASGEKTPAVDRMALMYSGQQLPNRCPRILSLTSSINGQLVPADRKYKAEVKADDRENDLLSYEWVLMSESTGVWRDGNYEPTPLVIEGCFTSKINCSTISFTTPSRPGPYRLFVYVRDGHGGGATQNIVFYVKEDAPVITSTGSVNGCL